jgi:hypothetical protein
MSENSKRSKIVYEFGTEMVRFLCEVQRALPDWFPSSMSAKCIQFFPEDLNQYGQLFIELNERVLYYTVSNNGKISLTFRQINELTGIIADLNGWKIEEAFLDDTD